MTRHLVALMAVSILIAGCIPPSPVATPTPDPNIRCNEILHPALLSVPFDELAKGREQTEEWIVTQFPTATVDFDPRGSSSEDIGRFSWSEGDKGFALHFYSGSRYIDQFEHSAKRPTLGQILHCYGDPQYYLLQTNVPLVRLNGIRLQLWYPALGVIFESAESGFPPDRITADYRMIGSPTIVPPGTPEEMLRSGIPRPEENIQEILALLKEWPEDFTEFVLEEKSTPTP